MKYYSLFMFVNMEKQTYILNYEKADCNSYYVDKYWLMDRMFKNK